jgi:Fungal chitosanase of glycosyl hydrolase group 75
MIWFKKTSSLLLALMLPASCLAQNPAPAGNDSPDNPGAACPVKSLLMNFDVEHHDQIVGEAPIWRLREDAAFFFTAGLAIDADGAPNAYNADNTGLDDLSNAGGPGHWDGVLQDQDGNPLVQGPEDPFPGYYISCTALSDWTKERFDLTRFVDASKIPYIALPGSLARASGARLGDVAAVFNRRNGRYSFAIFADIGTFGEGSIALAENLGISPDARRGGSWGGLTYLVFPGSGDHRPKSVEDINQIGAALLQEWGGAEQMRSCLDYGGSGWRPWQSWPAASNPASAATPASATPEAKPIATGEHAPAN